MSKVFFVIALALGISACGGSTTSGGPTGSGSGGGAIGDAGTNSGLVPAFAASSGLFVTVDELKADFDKSSDMILLDVRPVSDYTLGHIAGAISFPFFDVEDRFGELPRDRWLVAYCACPHSESEATAKKLMTHGFTKLKVIEEGYRVWVDRKYPIRSGNQP